VYFHHFYDDIDTVSDKELRIKVAETIDVEHPREWYWALMDYGSFLKKQGVGRIAKSAHYKKQAPLKGSLREVRGLILKSLSTGAFEEAVLKKHLPDDERFAIALAALIKEGMVTRSGTRVHLS